MMYDPSTVNDTNPDGQDVGSDDTSADDRPTPPRIELADLDDDDKLDDHAELSRLANDEQRDAHAANLAELAEVRAVPDHMRGQR